MTDGYRAWQTPRHHPAPRDSSWHVSPEYSPDFSCISGLRHRGKREARKEALGPCVLPSLPAPLVFLRASAKKTSYLYTRSGRNRSRQADGDAPTLARLPPSKLFTAEEDPGAIVHDDPLGSAYAGLRLAASEVCRACLHSFLALRFGVERS